jgi:flagellar motor switch protein FliN
MVMSTIGFTRFRFNSQDGSVATLDKVALDISVVLGTAWMPIHQVLRLGRGAIIELESTENDEVKILANNLPVAQGAVVVSGNRIAVEVKRMLPRGPNVR